MYIDLGRGTANRVVLSIITNGIHISRTWKIKISQIPCGQLSMAPSGCMQYFRSPSDVIKSFNYGIDQNPAGGARYLANLRYTSCIRLEEVLFVPVLFYQEFLFKICCLTDFPSYPSY